jgi:hypothetical protein
MIDLVMGGPNGNNGATAAKGGIWNTIQQLYPVSLSDIMADPNLSQNTGY